ncbi:MAG: DNA-cytosine methyltransferase [Betaproteobacteria bacterium]|nr:DNA-cytosine methyltransferase [Betaproteobacteria bacterium]
MRRENWTREQLLVAFNLYCQLPFGRLHSKNPTIIELARLLDRTPSALAMKLVNFASLDPAITGTGRSGLGNASAGDRAIWNEFHADWDSLAVESQTMVDRITDHSIPELASTVQEPSSDYFVGETRDVQIEQRVRQSFFRKAVLTNYKGRCCISELGEPRLLIASHIVPWSMDKGNRLNLHNGLCLSALHDRAFDSGLITVQPDLKVRVSSQLNDLVVNELARISLLNVDGKEILPAFKFQPNREFLDWHQREVFLG